LHKVGTPTKLQRVFQITISIINQNKITTSKKK